MSFDEKYYGSVEEFIDEQSQYLPYKAKLKTYKKVGDRISAKKKLKNGSSVFYEDKFINPAKLDLTNYLKTIKG